MALRDYRDKLYWWERRPKIENELRKHQCNNSRIDIVHSTQVVEMSDRAWSGAEGFLDQPCCRSGEAW